MIRTGGAAPKAAVAFVFPWFAIGGAAHFLFTETEMRIVPPRVPCRRQAELFPAVPCWALVLRLPLQVALLAVIWRVARGTR